MAGAGSFDRFRSRKNPMEDQQEEQATATAELENLKSQVKQMSEAWRSSTPPARESRIRRNRPRSRRR